MYRPFFCFRVCISKVVLLFLLALTVSVNADRVDRYVDKDSTNPEPPYDSWDNAARDIQTAINAAVAANEDEVIVRAGEYDTGGTEIVGAGSTPAVFTNRIHIGKGITVRSENNDPENTIIKGAWNPVSTNGPGAVRAVYITSAHAKLIGFTVTNGATLTYAQTYDLTLLCGGGIYSVNPAAVISNCVISGNVAHGYSGNGGAGAYKGTYYNCRFVGNRFLASGGYPYGGGVFGGTLYNCHLTGNVAARGGGAFCGTLYSCVVSNNAALVLPGGSGYSRGGGVSGIADNWIKVYDSTIVDNCADRGGGAACYSMLENCDIIANMTPVTLGEQGFGGGLFSQGAMNIVANNCRILYNKSNLGGGMYNASVTNCVITYNEAIHYGGGADSSDLVNCLLYGNLTPIASWLGGGGVNYRNSNFRLESCTIVGNEPDGIRVEGAASDLVPIINSIIYDNTPANYAEKAGSFVFNNCCTTPAKAEWDASNIAADPKFVAMGSGYGMDHIPGQYQLGNASPAKNTGINRPWMQDALDMDGNPRIDKYFGRVDMGCYEHIYRGTLFLLR